MVNNKDDILNIKKLFLLFLGVPLIGYLFYTGNYGNFYGYYLTGYYLIVILFFSYLISFFCRFRLGKIAVFLFLLFFLKNNLGKTLSLELNNS